MAVRALPLGQKDQAGCWGHILMAGFRGHLQANLEHRGCFQKLASPNLSRMVEDSLVEEAVQQKQVLELLSDLDFEKASRATSIEESK